MLYNYIHPLGYGKIDFAYIILVDIRFVFQIKSRKERTVMKWIKLYFIDYIGSDGKQKYQATSRPKKALEPVPGVVFNMSKFDPTAKQGTVIDSGFANDIDEIQWKKLLAVYTEGYCYWNPETNDCMSESEYADMQSQGVSVPSEQPTEQLPA
tara:strand:+ start:5959 stop:6417 length:459 start_codon:yes stop_codon:yes gene_type:complete